MPENTDEEHLNIPPAIQPAEGAEEIIPAAETETTTADIINANPATENMEVHKHAHHVTHKKKWGEYLLEFLMLFLAVFLGFVAENIREHQVEREREKEYMWNL